MGFFRIVEATSITQNKNVFKHWNWHVLHELCPTYEATSKVGVTSKRLGMEALWLGSDLFIFLFLNLHLTQINNE